MNGNDGMIHRGRRIVDLIAGVTPTFSGWTVDPTDAADITDGDPTTFCTTGNKAIGAGYQYAYFDWDLGAFYNILCTGIGQFLADAGTTSGYVYFWNGAAWIDTQEYVLGWDSGVQAFTPMSGYGSKVRLGYTSDAAATITHNIREFHAWRL